MAQDPNEVARLKAEFSEEVTEQSRSFDKAVTTLSAGGLALSITFVRDIAPALQNPVRLGVAWAAFVLALLFSMASYLASEYAHRHLIAQLGQGENLSLGVWGVTTSVLNVLSGLGVAVGAGALAYFAYGNIGGKG